MSLSILCVGNSWFPTMPGGLNRYVYELIYHLAAEDKVELCGVGLPETSSSLAIELTNLSQPNISTLKRLWSSYTNFKQRSLIKPDAVNLHFAFYSFPLLTSLPKDVPITFTFHGPWALESEREGGGKLSVFFKKWVEQRVYQRCDRFIVLSKAFGMILHDQYEVPLEKIYLIPGGVDIQRFQPNLSREEARAQLNFPQGRKILFAPRRLVHRMGLDKLLLALTYVKRQVPDVWLAIAGKGPLRDALEKQSIELGLEEHVRFLGFLPDEQLPIAYQAADLTVVPSQALEGFGLILLESLACGTPVLCTPVGGMPEILTPFAPQLITESKDIGAIAARLQALLEGELTMPSRTECREYAVTHFDWQKIAQQVRHVLLAKKM
ncbi:glycosyltransferase family 4 protein [Oscillatoria sp. FACHB-1407]|uniref:glycosyltransferase family 4 protein n=1 Tax=Oscillatoria sp. FACHB-1407 TaxID=2692847 RepID=UPI00168244AF|nr:glycosyltransferase family 4 protein [Oscillatoria sp. FACHB-1407]MBD2459708.1 glycosyltransferase family 4 protein [Oscillatoria sp. FACHB-1407]